MIQFTIHNISILDDHSNDVTFNNIFNHIKIGAEQSSVKEREVFENKRKSPLTNEKKRILSHFEIK